MVLSSIMRHNLLQPNIRNFPTVLAIVITAVLTALIIGGGVYWWQNLRIRRGVIIETTEFFPVYGADRNYMNTEINFYLRIPKNLPLIEKLKIIADRLSRFQFGYLPMEVLRLEKQNGKKIAVINLREHEWNRNIDWNKPQLMSGSAGVTWRAHYFQGSASGGFTRITLTETFLQRKYEENWIDGVVFLYENEPIGEEDWGHSLSGKIYYRKIENNEK